MAIGSKIIKKGIVINDPDYANNESLSAIVESGAINLTASNNTLNITAASGVDITAAVLITGNTDVTGTFDVTGVTTLGSTVNVGGGIVPDSNNSYAIGTTNFGFTTAYVNTINSVASTLTLSPTSVGVNGATTVVSGGFSTGAGGGTVGGNLLLNGGNVSSGLTGGQIILTTYGGAGGGDTGAITIQTGEAFSSGNSGALSLSTGDSDSGNSANISITVGTSASGTRGRIILDADTIAIAAQSASDPSTSNAGDIYYNTTSNVLKYYNGSAWTTLEAGAAGTITGDYASSNADLTYDTTNDTYTFLGDSGTTEADVIVKDLILDDSGSANQTTLSSASLSGDVTYTFPTAAPASTTLPMLMDSSGNMSTGQIVTAQIASDAITATEIAAGAVDTSELADNAVTTVKITDGNVTYEKLEDLNYNIGTGVSDGTSSSTTNTTLTDVTNLTATITTHGRPVLLKLICDDATFEGTGLNTEQGSVVVNDSSVTGDTDLRGGIAFVRGSTVVACYKVSSSFLNLSSDSPSFEIPVSAFSTIDTPSSGTYTYKVQFAVSSGASIAIHGPVKLIAVEL